ncbi:uncharacterized protein LOC133735943 [Rosa rugosa]|uniref:uncharacterized protein LOC133735943 n=1 Tax=Rosa rugosa TaxID=74645 RepID=UPI002B40915A|nr:uncharacterized protein LOC133735943 [Rosa rugosa]
MGKEWFLYVVTDIGVHRLKLDIRKLRNGNRIPKLNQRPPVEFEDLELLSPDGKFPYYTQHIIVGSQVYLVGGYYSNDEPNISDAYAINPNTTCVTSAAFPYDYPDLLSALSKSSATLFQVGSSFYILDASQGITFYVLEPKGTDGCTKRILPNPPVSRVSNHTSWGHKIHITTLGIPFTSRGASYTFDLCKEKWDKWPDQFRAAVEYKGFFIGLLPTGLLVCSRMDSNGNPERPLKVLHDLFDIFNLKGPYFLELDQVFMGLFDDGEDNFIWLVNSFEGVEADLHCHMPFLLFRVFIENDPDDNSVLSAVLEAAEYYDFFEDNVFCTAFACANIN